MDGTKRSTKALQRKSPKIHVEITAGNWQRLDAYIKNYNHSPERVTPKYKLADVVNAALLAYLQARGL